MAAAYPGVARDVGCRVTVVMKRTIGRSGIVVSAVGFGCMRLSEPREGEAGERALSRAVDLGITHFDTADIYGYGHNERLVGRVLRRTRPRVVIATKCGIIRHGGQRVRNGTKRYIRAACHASLRRLNTDYIDILYLHRVDPMVPIEESVAALASLVTEGKVRALGLSKVTADVVTRAAAVHQVSAVQMRYSLSSREVETGLLDSCRTIGAALVAYSPLGEGLLTERIASLEDLLPGDRRRRSVRFQSERVSDARARFSILRARAASQGCTPSQLALAWLLSRGADVLPLPGMRSPAHVEENAATMSLALSPAAFENW